MRLISWEHDAKSSASGHLSIEDLYETVVKGHHIVTVIPSYKTHTFVITQETNTSPHYTKTPTAMEKMKQDMKQELELMRNDIRKEFSDGMEALKKKIIRLRSRVEASVEEETTKLKEENAMLKRENAELKGENVNLKSRVEALETACP